MRNKEKEALNEETKEQRNRSEESFPIKATFASSTQEVFWRRCSDGKKFLFLTLSSRFSF